MVHDRATNTSSSGPSTTRTFRYLCPATVPMVFGTRTRDQRDGPDLTLDVDFGISLLSRTAAPSSETLPKRSCSMAMLEGAKANHCWTVGESPATSTAASGGAGA